MHGNSSLASKAETRGLNMPCVNKPVAMVQKAGWIYGFMLLITNCDPCTSSGEPVPTATPD